MKQRILIIDDDVDLTAMLATFLTQKGLAVSLIHQARQVPSDLSDFDLVLLDINLPYEDGFSLCRRIRQTQDLPIIFISARDSESDTIKGLMLGGDDYVAKPFSLKELYARIQANLRRTAPPVAPAVYRLDPAGYRFYLHNQLVNLTRVEFEVIDLLAGYPNQVFSKERIYDQIWGYEADGDPQVVAEHIRNIRNKLKAIDPECDLIKTVWGVGYSWLG